MIKSFALSMVFLICSLAVLAGTASLLVLVLGSSRFITTCPRELEERHELILANPADYGLSLESGEVTSEDNLLLTTCLVTRSEEVGTATKLRSMQTRLAARGIERSASLRGTVVIVHGRGGFKENMLAIAMRYIAADFRCIIYDQRAHGQSEGNYCTYGIRERRDLSSVLDHYENLLGQRGEPLGPVHAFGLSMGAATLLLATETESRLASVTAICPYAELPSVARIGAKQRVHDRLPNWLIDATLWTAGKRAGFNPWDVQPIRAAAAWDRPIYLVHGTLDGVIPIEHGHRLRDVTRGENCRWEEIPSAYHGDVLAEGGDDLYERLVCFAIDAS
ncbi:MAG: alpha/beta fold hydrolase [Verrucomicrobiota bacterium]